jgi:hypothetical protein
MDVLKPSEEEMMGALTRSGYLLESQISKVLTDSGFMIRTNQVIIDPITGKNREIDLIAEYSEFAIKRTGGCCSRVTFVFEIKNNSAPLVLLTKHEYSPHISDWYGLKEHITIPNGLTYETFDQYYSELILEGTHSIFTQYCSFQKKKANEELMALHPDNIYEGFSKISQYCEEQAGDREVKVAKNDYLRHFLYLPILLIRDDLYELHYDEEHQPVLKKVDSSILVYNYHTKGEPAMAYIYIVTKNGFADFINNTLDLEREIEEKMIKSRKEQIIKSQVSVGQKEK